MINELKKLIHKFDDLEKSINKNKKDDVLIVKSQAKKEQARKQSVDVDKDKCCGKQFGLFDFNKL